MPYSPEPLTTTYKDVTGVFAGTFNVTATADSQLFLWKAGMDIPTVEQGSPINGGETKVIGLTAGDKLYARANTGNAILRMNGGD